MAAGGGVELDEGVAGDGGVGDDGVEGVAGGDLDAGGEGAVVGCGFGFEGRGWGHGFGGVGGGEVVGEEGVDWFYFFVGGVGRATVVVRNFWWEEVVSLEVVSHHGGVDLSP